MVDTYDVTYYGGIHVHLGELVMGHYRYHSPLLYHDVFLVFCFVLLRMLQVVRKSNQNPDRSS